MKLAAIGDIHGCWDSKDVEYFNRSDYDAILIVGDLPGRTHTGLEAIAESISKLTKPSYFMPGNHDGVSVVQLLAELKHNEALIKRSYKKQLVKCARLKKSLGSVEYCGYTKHTLTFQNQTIDLIGARPHSMGGDWLAFEPYLEMTYGIATLDQSRERILSLLMTCENPILVLSHNGPTGLGAKRTDIWGCDFLAEQGDFGDPDLEQAIYSARQSGRTVLGVIAGHMHHRLKGGGERASLTKKEEILYMNAARVPRTFQRDGHEVRHHMLLEIKANSLSAEHKYITP